MNYDLFTENHSRLYHHKIKPSAAQWTNAGDGIGFVQNRTEQAVDVSVLFLKVYSDHAVCRLWLVMFL
ncbi:hypothetical protein [Paenibacillus typhae]|uniref:hypothetical protein n=1 Tax=Paenibacillus typhae TaxID=1174501 RepID=UPI0039EE1852